MTDPIPPAEPTPTHWSAVDPEKWTLGPETSPLEAADVYLRESEDEDAMLALGNDLLSQGRFSIEVQGYVETDELLGEDDDQFDDYEPGDTYFRPVGKPVTVIVERTMRIKEAK